MNLKEKINFLIKILLDLYPTDKIELNYNNSYQLLIAVIMSAQTTDKQVNKVNEKFFKILKEPKDAIKLWIEWIKKHIQTIWLYNTKAKNIYNTSKLLIEKYNWDIPNSLEELLKLPWVWIKTAKVILSTLYNKPVMPVDTHVHRVLNRIWILKTKNAIETDKQIENIFNKKEISILHHRLILFWRYYCKAKNPKCKNCKLNKICFYYKNKN